uniref:FAM3 metabolism regulating signaling molecule A n=1 Tax=Canis lupus familiaris TaxID=9615 RepID=A0A8C0TG74_CANLF
MPTSASSWTSSVGTRCTLYAGEGHLCALGVRGDRAGLQVRGQSSPSLAPPIPPRSTPASHTVSPSVTSSGKPGGSSRHCCIRSSARSHSPSLTFTADRSTSSRPQNPDRRPRAQPQARRPRRAGIRRLWGAGGSPAGADVGSGRRRTAPPLRRPGSGRGRGGAGAGPRRVPSSERPAAGPGRTAGAEPAGRGPARAAIAGPAGQRCAPPSRPLAERSRAAGLTGLPQPSLRPPPRPGQRSTSQACGVTAGPSPGRPRRRPASGRTAFTSPPGGSGGHDREPTGSRGPSCPGSAPVRVPEGRPAAGPSSRRSDRQAPAHPWVPASAALLLCGPRSAPSPSSAPAGGPHPPGAVDMRLAGPLRIVALIVAVGLTWIVVSILLGGPGSGFPRIQQLFISPDNSATPEPRARKYKCGLPQPCPEEHLAFRMVSGAANVIGPKICLEDRMLMSSVKDNVGRGLNIALVNGVSGELIEARAFDMWAGDVNDLLKFIRPLHEGTLVFVASYDDPATKMNEETRKLFSDLGSKNVKDLAFRDSWVFVGAKGVQNKSPFEQPLLPSRPLLLRSHTCQAPCEGLGSPRHHPHAWEPPSLVTAMLPPQPHPPQPNQANRLFQCFLEGVFCALSQRATQHPENKCSLWLGSP